MIFFENLFKKIFSIYIAMLTNVDKVATKLAKQYHCDLCNYICSKKSDMKKHVYTLKHQNVDKMLTNDDKNATFVAENITQLYECICGKNYLHRQSLSLHKKKCSILAAKNNSNKDELIDYLMKENSDLKTMVLDVCKQIQPSNSIINSNINSNNKTFNLNVFLNEQCKDAMNITDFVDSLQLQLSDLETVGKLGFVEGISNIIIKNLKAMDICKRPVHCSDPKREVMYIKDQDKWEKECQDNTKLRKAIKRVAYKNTKMLPVFREKHPDCGKSESKYSDQYNKLIIEAMGGKGDNDTEKENKIIKNIAKEVIIDKNK
jgi:hypothetical protein